MNLEVELDSIYRSITDADILLATQLPNRRGEVSVTPKQKTCAVKSSMKSVGLTRTMTVTAYIVRYPHPEVPIAHAFFRFKQTQGFVGRHSSSSSVVPTQISTTA